LPDNILDLVNVLSSYDFTIPYQYQERIKNLRHIAIKPDGSYIKLGIMGFLITGIHSSRTRQDGFYDLCLLLLQKSRSFVTGMTSFHLTHGDINALVSKWCNTLPGSDIVPEKLNTIIKNLSNADRASFNSRLLLGCIPHKMDYTTRSQGGKKKRKKTKKRRKL